MRWLVSSVFLLGLAHCGIEAGGVISTPGVDASLIDTSVKDTQPPKDAPSDQLVDVADVSSPGCDLSKPFGAAVGVTEINTTGENEGLRLFNDGLNAVIGSTRAFTQGGFDLQFTSRANLLTPFATPTNGGLLNSPQEDGDGTLGNDGLVIYFDTKRLGFYQLYQVKRGTINDAFGYAAPIPFVSFGAANDFEPFVTKDGQRMLFVSDRDPKIGKSDVYRTQIGSNGYFDPPVAVPELSVANTRIYDPILSLDELTIYFASDRPDVQAKGKLDIWTAKRPSLAAPFTTPKLVPELNTTSSEGPSQLTDDGCTLYFTSDRAGGLYEVYVATKPK